MATTRERVPSHTREEINWRIRFSPRVAEGAEIMDEGEDNREVVFAFSAAEAGRWTKRDTKDIKKELYKAQAAVDAPRKAFNKLLQVVKK